MRGESSARGQTVTDGVMGRVHMLVTEREQHLARVEVARRSALACLSAAATDLSKLGLSLREQARILGVSHQSVKLALASDAVEMRDEPSQNARVVVAQPPSPSSAPMQTDSRPLARCRVGDVNDARIGSGEGRGEVGEAQRAPCCSARDGACRSDPETEEETGFELVYAELLAAQNRDRVVAVLDDAEHPTRVELRRSLSAALQADLMLQLAGGFSERLATEAGAHITSSREHALVAGAVAARAKKAAQQLRTPAALALAKTSQEAATRAEADARATAALYRDHPEAIELVQRVAHRLAVFERQKPNLPWETLAALRMDLAKQSEKALDGFRYYAESDQRLPTEKTALLMLAARRVAERVPRGERVAARDPTRHELSIWSRLPEQTKAWLADTQDDCCWRWREPPASDVERALDAAVEELLASVPELGRWFSTNTAIASMAPMVAEKRQAVRAMIALFVHRRKPNAGTNDLRRLKDERALRQIWGLPAVRVVERDAEASALIPLLDLINATPRSGDGNEVRAVKVNIRRGIEIREGRRGTVLFEKSPMASARKSGTRAVLERGTSVTRLSVDGTSPTTRATAPANPTFRPHGNRQRHGR